MEEDIKICEEIVETYYDCAVVEDGFDMRVDMAFMKKEAKALENLIKGYKLEKLKNVLDEQSLKETLEEYIPKSKIKEKIKTLNNQYKEIASKYTEEELDNGEEGLDDYIEMQKIQKAENILQEFLEEDV